MVSEKIKELELTRAKLASLEQAIADELSAELAVLPERYGFGSAEEFLKAVAAATGTSLAKKGRKPARAGSKGKAPKSENKRRIRAVITTEIREQVKLLCEGGKTGAEIAAALQISKPTVQNIKKALGLVKPR
jgi:DNA invertase Pin-like site-specific DNA recombinase